MKWDNYSGAKLTISFKLTSVQKMQNPGSEKCSKLFWKFLFQEKLLFPYVLLFTSNFSWHSFPFLLFFLDFKLLIIDYNCVYLWNKIWSFIYGRKCEILFNEMFNQAISYINHLSNIAFFSTAEILRIWYFNKYRIF